jgi:dihydrofolate reductase
MPPMTAIARAAALGGGHGQGPTLAAHFIERGLVDEYHMVVHPVVLGAGTPFFPPGVSRFDLRLTESRAFASGAMYLGYEAVR